jgi:hypothetical protein
MLIIKTATVTCPRPYDGPITSPLNNGGPIMTSITESAKAFFAACEAGKGWDVCSAYCTPDATFAAQAEPLMDVNPSSRIRPQDSRFCCELGAVRS